MVTKNQSAKKQVKVGKLKLNKETVKDLSSKDAKKIKGGAEVDFGPKHKTEHDITAFNTVSPTCNACPKP